jgi:hypothetical protein
MQRDGSSRAAAVNSVVARIALCVASLARATHHTTMNDQSPERVTPATTASPTLARYDFAAAEPRWQAEWDRRRCFAVPDVPPPNAAKYYVLEMFPYPSGKIHMGHVRNYTLGDVVARYKRARGHLVMHPMGWDAFGLPAENAARERGIHPGKWTYDNIANMRAELQRMGLSLEWAREFATCDAAYYGKQQKLFLDFWKAGLVERKESWVNWDPVDGTVLANEQVIDGRGWRSGAPVEKKKLSQWFLSITNYAPELLEALGSLDRWPERVKLMQSNWIGRSEGGAGALPADRSGRRHGGGGGLHHPPGHAVRHELPGGGRRAPAGRGCRGARPQSRRVRRGVPPHGHLGSRDRAGGEAGLRHRLPRRASPSCRA